MTFRKAILSFRNRATEMLSAIEEEEEERRRSTLDGQRPLLTTVDDKEVLVPSRSLTKQLTGIHHGVELQTVNLEVGSGIDHPLHGHGRIVEIMTDNRAKPYKVEFKDGEVFHCSAEPFILPPVIYPPLHQVHHYSLNSLNAKCHVGDKAKMFDVTQDEAPTLVKKQLKRLTGWNSQKDLFAKNPVLVFKRGCSTHSDEMTHDDFKALVPDLDEVCVRVYTHADMYIRMLT